MVWGFESLVLVEGKWQAGREFTSKRRKVGVCARGQSGGVLPPEAKHPFARGVQGEMQWDAKMAQRDVPCTCNVNPELILWMDEILHRFETMRNHVLFGIYKGIYHSVGFLRWCEMDFATIHSRVAGGLEVPKFQMAVAQKSGKDQDLRKPGS